MSSEGHPEENLLLVGAAAPTNRRLCEDTAPKRTSLTDRKRDIRRRRTPRCQRSAQKKIRRDLSRRILQLPRAPQILT
jgi:hypothetical protein